LKKLLEIPDDLFRIILSNAKENRRSATQEIIKMLEDSVSIEQPGNKLCGNKAG